MNHNHSISLTAGVKRWRKQRSKQAQGESLRRQQTLTKPVNKDGAFPHIPQTGAQTISKKKKNNKKKPTVLWQLETFRLPRVELRLFMTSPMIFGKSVTLSILKHTNFSQNQTFSSNSTKSWLPFLTWLPLTGIREA